jgi:hypothetical protein
LISSFSSLSFEFQLQCFDLLPPCADFNARNEGAFRAPIDAQELIGFSFVPVKGFSDTLHAL